MINEKFVILAAAINFSGSLSYIHSTLKGKTKPNKMTWFLWAVAPLIAFFAQLKEHVGWVALTTLMAGLMPLLILIASIFNKKSYWKLSSIDYICGLISVLALVLWLVTGKGLLAITFGILADFVAALPTLKKSFYQPGTEHHTIFLLASISAIITLLTISNWRVENYIFALYLLVIDVVLFCLIRFKIGTRQY